MERVLRAGIAWVALVLLAPACGGDPSVDETETQPVPGATDFEGGAFDELPMYPGSAAVNDPAVEDDVVSQSFEIRATGPGQVMDFFATELSADGWTAIDGPGQTGADGTYRGVWQRSDQELVVSATRFSDSDDPGGERLTQYSLSLGPSRPEAQ